jgi:hypothetical protein
MAMKWRYIEKLQLHAKWQKLLLAEKQLPLSICSLVGLPCGMTYYLTEVGKVTWKINGNEALKDKLFKKVMAMKR